MIRISGSISIPENEIRFSASRAGGPGGQNVNKVSSRVNLSFDVNQSGALSDNEKRRIREKLAPRINKDGVLQVVSQRTRSQDINRTDALEKFATLLRRALAPSRPRIKTSIPAAAKEQRLLEKRKRTRIKQERTKWRDEY